VCVTGTAIALLVRVLKIQGVPLVLQVAVPLALLVWQAVGRDCSLGGWLMKTTIVLLYLTVVHLAGLWVVLPWHGVTLSAMTW
jgi:hypothetical protein